MLNILLADGHNKVFLREEVDFGCPRLDSFVIYLLTVVRVVSGRRGQSSQDQDSLRRLKFSVKNELKI